MPYLDINDAALARHIKAYARKEPKRIVIGKIDDGSDLVGTGYIVVKTLLGSLPKTRAALAECNIQPAEPDRIKTFTDYFSHWLDHKQITITPTRLQLLTSEYRPKTLRIYRSGPEDNRLWFLDAEQLKIFGEPTFYSSSPINLCYLADKDGADAIICPYKPDLPLDDVRKGMEGIIL